MFLSISFGRRGGDKSAHWVNQNFLDGKMEDLQFKRGKHSVTLPTLTTFWGRVIFEILQHYQHYLHYCIQEGRWKRLTFCNITYITNITCILSVCDFLKCWNITIITTFKEVGERDRLTICNLYYLHSEGVWFFEMWEHYQHYLYY